MNRARFLKLLSASRVQVEIPVDELEQQVKDSGATFVHETREANFGDRTGIACFVRLGEKSAKHAFGLDTLVWQALSQAQRAEVWTRLDAMVLDRLKNGGPHQ